MLLILIDIFRAISCLDFWHIDISFRHFRHGNAMFYHIFVQPERTAAHYHTWSPLLCRLINENWVEWLKRERWLIFTCIRLKKKKPDVIPFLEMNSIILNNTSSKKVSQKPILSFSTTLTPYFHRYSLGHGWTSHALLSLASPEHGSPPLAGLGLTQ